MTGKLPKKLNIISKQWYTNCTMSITFGDRVENHVGIQMIGELASEGFTFSELISAKTKFELKGCDTELIELHTNIPISSIPNTSSPKDYIQKEGLKAWILIVRDGTNVLNPKNNPTELYHEQDLLSIDKKVKMCGNVVNKHARQNLCYGETSQEPNYESGKGCVVAFSDVPILNEIRNNMSEFIGPKANKLQAELNKYNDVNKCGIGFHGDSERKIVSCARIGASLDLHYQWFLEGKPIGDRIKLKLNHGDFYVMSEKATGFDWKRRKIPTLMHAAGCKKYLTIKDMDLTN